MAIEGRILFFELASRWERGRTVVACLEWGIWTRRNISMGLLKLKDCDSNKIERESNG